MYPKDKYIGRAVRVTGRGHYKDTAIGRTGTIRSYWNDDSIGVQLDGIKNTGSQYGYFYMKLTELEFIEAPKVKKENTEEVNDMQKIDNYLNIAVVQFVDDDRLNAPTYEYANFDPCLGEGDLCAVMSKSHGMGLAEVVEIKDRNGAALSREVVARVDAAAYYDRVEHRRKAAELKAKMQERAKKLQDISLYKLLAAEDEEMAGLLAEYLNTMNV